MNPFIIDETQARYQARLDAAAAWRLEQTMRAAMPSPDTQLRLAIGNHLITWGMRMKTQIASAEASQ